MLSQTKKLKGAIIGYGFISSKGHMPAYIERLKTQNDVEIIAICDSAQERCRDVPAGIKFYTDFQELLLNVGQQLDFIDVATHAADHYKIAKMALNQGLHVLCEKPLTTSVTDAYDLIRTAVEKNKVLFPCHNYKHAPVVKAIREEIKRGRIGSVKSITLNTFRNTHALGTSDWFPDWRRHKEFSGGGIAMDHGSHSLYLTFEWLGGYPKSVSASSQNFAHPKFDTEDNFSAVYEFETGMANVHLSWTAGARKVIYTVQGDKGAITVDDDQMLVSLLEQREDYEDNTSHKASWSEERHSIESDWMDSSHVSWFNSMFDDFKTAIIKEDIKNKEIIDAYYCILAIMKSYESIEKNCEKLPIMNDLVL